MSNTQQRMPLRRGRELADNLVSDFAPYCRRIEIAGSIRRRIPDVGDIEIVAEPLWRANLLGDPSQSFLDPVLESMRERRLLVSLKNGPRYKQFELVHAGCRLDLFLCTVDTFAVNLLLRTGPQGFSKRIVTKESMGDFKDARLVRDGQTIITPDEKDVFRSLGRVYVEPWKRL